MSEEDVLPRGVLGVGEEVEGVVVGEVSVSAHDALFDGEGAFLIGLEEEFVII